MDIDLATKAGYLTSSWNAIYLDAFQKYNVSTDWQIVPTGNRWISGDHFFDSDMTLKPIYPRWVGDTIESTHVVVFRRITTSTIASSTPTKWSCGHRRDTGEPYCYVCKGFYCREVTS